MRRTLRSECEICRGSGTIRLPIYRSVRIADAPSYGEHIEATSRVFACPECGETVPQDRIKVLDVHAMIDGRYVGDLDAEAHVCRHLANILAMELLRGDHIYFEDGPVMPRTGSAARMATIGVVSKGHVASIEERATKRGLALANAVKAKFLAAIYGWRTDDYVIRKADAARMIEESFRDVSASWRKVNAVGDSKQEG